MTELNRRWEIRKNSEGADPTSVSDAKLPLAVAKLKQQLQAARDKAEAKVTKTEEAVKAAEAKASERSAREETRATERETRDADKLSTKEARDGEKVSKKEERDGIAEMKRIGRSMKILMRSKAQEAATEKAAEREQKQAVPKVAVKVPKAADDAPRASSTPRDPTFDIVTNSGTRQQSIAGTKSRKAYSNAVTDNVIARGDIFEAAMEVPGLSQTAITILGQNMGPMTDRAFNSKSGDAARGLIERFIDVLPKADQAKLREHFRNFKDPVTDKTFYDTWKD